MALYDAVETWRESGDLEDLCNIALAERALEEYGAKRERLAELRWALAAKRAAREGEAGTGAASGVGRGTSAGRCPVQVGWRR